MIPRVESNGLRRYGTWAGNPKGMKEDISRCVESVSDRFVFYQCSLKRGFGYKGLFCKQHAKKYHVWEDDNEGKG